MNRIRNRFALLLLALAAPLIGAAQSATAPTPYGANPTAGHTFTHDGVTLYYEVYGAGAPLLMIHGNGASIGSLAAQIAHFREHYQVIAMDSRDHGRSADSAGPLNYETMTDDLAALLDHLQIPPRGRTRLERRRHRDAAARDPPSRQGRTNSSPWRRT